MQIGKFDTEAAREQLRILFDLKEILNRRGLEVASFEDFAKLLFDANSPTTVEACFNSLKSNSFRRVISFVTNSENGEEFESIKSRHSGLTGAKIQ